MTGPVCVVTVVFAGMTSGKVSPVVVTPPLAPRTTILVGSVVPATEMSLRARVMVLSAQLADVPPSAPWALPVAPSLPLTGST